VKADTNITALTSEAGDCKKEEKKRKKKKKKKSAFRH
jgi:hypothetical protein